MKDHQHSFQELNPILHASRTSFKQTIQKIQLIALKQILEKKRIASVRNRLKQQWLERKKIISPHISPADRQNLFRATDSFSSKDTDCFRIHKHNCFKKDDFRIDDELLFQKKTLQLVDSTQDFSRKQLAQRQSYAASSVGFQRYRMDQLKQRKFKENWKHCYRRDQINVLRFSSANNSSEAKFLKTGQIGKIPYTLLISDAREPISSYQTKVNVCQIVSNRTEEDNKENNQIQFEEKKEEKKFRLNVKKNKTSLIVKKELLP